MKIYQGAKKATRVPSDCEAMTLSKLLGVKTVYADEEE